MTSIRNTIIISFVTKSNLESGFMNDILLKRLSFNKVIGWPVSGRIFHKKKKSGGKGKTIEEKAASWRFYSVMSFMKLYMAGQK